jgi:Na+-driven multidrug efflux pump
VTSSFFQSIGKAKVSIVLSLTRQVLFLIPALVILPRFLGLNGVWLGSPAADLTATLVTLVVLQRQLKKIKDIKIHNRVTVKKNFHFSEQSAGL